MAEDGTFTATITDEEAIKKLSQTFFSFSIPAEVTGESENFTD